MASASTRIVRSSAFLLSNVYNAQCSRNLKRLTLTYTCAHSRSTPVTSPHINGRFYASTSAGSTGSGMEQEQVSILKQIEEQQAKDEDDAKKKREKQWRNTKMAMAFLGCSFGFGAGYMLYQFSIPKRDEEGNIIPDEFSHLPFPQQQLGRIKKEIEYYQKFFGEPSREKLLPDPLTYPYIQPPYTLVLEVTDLLLHPDWTYQTGWRFKKRPGVDHFLQQVAPPLFEVVVYTAESGMNLFPVLDALDPNGYIMYRLFRDATHFVDGHHIKALDYLNRDLSKVIVVDWNSESVKKHPRNALLIPRWNGNDDDTTLIDLASFLKVIASNQVEDVREVLDYYQQFEDPIKAYRDNQRKVLEQLEKSEKERKDNPQGLAQRWRPTFLNKQKV